MQDSYNKRLTFLIHGFEETSAWETRSESMNVCETFLSEALDLDPANLSIVDVHRLPQRPVFKDSEKVDRLIIVKLSNAFDKSQVFNQLKNLKEYNATQQRINPQSKRVYITEHLPAIFQQQRKSFSQTF